MGLDKMRLDEMALNRCNQQWSVVWDWDYTFLTELLFALTMIFPLSPPFPPPPPPPPPFSSSLLSSSSPSSFASNPSPPPSPSPSVHVNPYCEVIVDGQKSGNLRTETIRRSDSPEWDEEFTVYVWGRGWGLEWSLLPTHAVCWLLVTHSYQHTVKLGNAGTDKSFWGIVGCL